MSRPRTRNQKMMARLNTPTWPFEYDDFMMESAVDVARSMETLRNNEAYEDLLYEVYLLMVFHFENNFDEIAIKCRMDWFRNRFMSFKSYIATDGVMFNRHTKKITLDRSLWPWNRRETDEERMFRVNGFPLFEECKFVFESKQAPACNFDGIMGFSPNNPLVIDGDDEDDENDVSVDDEPVVFPDHEVPNIENNVIGNIGAPNDVNEPAVSISDHDGDDRNSESQGSVGAD
ncbi:hypothetical protein ABFS83_14G081900 [Erythranthe nasuta]